MGVWGKIIGGTVGLAIGGPLGALVGAGAGHMMFDRKSGRNEVDDADTRQIAFSIAFVTLAAKLAKADGRVTRDEIQVLHQLLDTLDVPEEERGTVGEVFNLAKRDARGFEPYARQIAQLLGRDEAMLEDMLGILILICHADGVYHSAEREQIAEIGRIFGFSRDRVRRVELRFDADGGGGEGDAYEILGVPADASDDEVKAAYRALLKDNHPDRLMAKGMPEEFVQAANRKMATINAAYDRVAKERGLS